MVDASVNLYKKTQLNINSKLEASQTRYLSHRPISTSYSSTAVETIFHLLHRPLTHLCGCNRCNCRLNRCARTSRPARWSNQIATNTLSKHCSHCRQAPENANAQKSTRRGFQPFNLGKTNSQRDYEPLGRTPSRRAQGDAFRFQRRTIQNAGRQDATSVEDGIA